MPAEDEQPCGDRAPGDQWLPDRISDCGPTQAAGEVRDSRAVQSDGQRADCRKRWQGDDQGSDPVARVVPFKLPEPVMTPGGNAQTKEEDVAGEVSKL